MNKNKITDIFLNLSNELIIDIFTNLFNIISNINPNSNSNSNSIINANFISKVSFNLCLMNYNQIYNLLISNQNNNIIEQIIKIEQLYLYDKIFILELLFEITIGFLKEFNTLEFILETHECFIDSIKKQIQLITNTNYINYTNLIQNYKFKKMFPIKK